MPPTHVEFVVAHPSSIGQLLHVDPSPRVLKWARVLVVLGTAAAIANAVPATLLWPSFGAGLYLVGAVLFAGVAVYYAMFLWRANERIARVPL